MNTVIDMSAGPMVRKDRPASELVPMPDVTPTQMVAIAVQRGADLAYVKELMDLQERWEANQARKAFNAALAAFKKNPPVVVKDMLNKQYGSKYSSLGNLVNVVNAALGEHGLSASWDPVVSGDVIKVTCILEHIDGHSKRVTIEGPRDVSGAKNTLQQIRSTLTYLKGDTFEAVTGIASKVANVDDDGNGAGKGEKAPEGYEEWKADMTALADEGSTKLAEAWKKSTDVFRRYVVKFDEPWWRQTKLNASKVAE
jgi:ERF superfamily protein